MNEIEEKNSIKKTLKTKQITIKNKDQIWHKNKKTRYIAILERICIENEEREKEKERKKQKWKYMCFQHLHVSLH
jgi:hypothetical protein